MRYVTRAALLRLERYYIIFSFQRVTMPFDMVARCLPLRAPEIEVECRDMIRVDRVMSQAFRQHREALCLLSSC